MNESELKVLSDLLDSKLEPIKKDLRTIKKDIVELRGDNEFLIDELGRVQENLEKKIEEVLVK